MKTTAQALFNLAMGLPVGGALLNTPAAAADSGSATQTIPVMPTPRLFSAGLSAPPPLEDGIVGAVIFTFDAPTPETHPEYRNFSVYEDGRFVASTYFPHDVTDTMTVYVCRRPDGTIGSCGAWSGDPPQMIPMSGTGVFTIKQSAPGYATSATSNGLVPVDNR